jgi:DNA-binding NtrC family response regulator
MPHVLLATHDDAWRERIERQLMSAGHPLRRAGDVASTVRELADPGCALALVDESLPGLDLDLLQRLGEALPHTPTLRGLGTAEGPLEVATGQQVSLLVSRLVGRLGGEDRRELRLLGLGKRSLAMLSEAAAGELPILLWGERGTGKKRLARAIHARAGGGPFIDEGELPEEGRRGTLYLASVERLDDLLARAEAARRAGWRVIAGSRLELDLVSWRHLHLAPVRERPDELRPLVRFYVERYRSRLGLPRRRLDRALWAALRSYSWPGNARELEGFVVQALTSSTGPVVRLAELPAAVRERLDDAPEARLRQRAVSFEQAAQDALEPLFDGLEPGLPLHRMAVGATEAALVRLALRRTGGDQRAAAKLLGLARNTLRTKAIEHGLLIPRTRR